MNGGELAEILARSNHDGGEGSSRKDGYGNTNVRGSRGVLGERTRERESVRATGTNVLLRGETWI